MIETTDLYNDAIVIDACSPLMVFNKEYVGYYSRGGVTAVAPTVTAFGGNASEQVKMLGEWLKFVRQNPKVLLVKSMEDIRRAKREERLGLIFHFQGTDSLEANLDLLDAYYALGVRMIQLTYNVKNRVGDGCTERTDSGLSEFGIKVVQRMNELGIAVDCSHTGHRTTLEAMEVSSRPVVFSHANAKALFDNKRNITDEQIKALAATRGVIGVNVVPYYMVNTIRPTMDHVLDHIEYIANLVGVDHVGIGFDYFGGQQPFISEEEATRLWQTGVDKGKYTPEVTPAPTQLYPEGLDTPEYMPNLVPAMLKRGFSQEDVRKILGGNWMRVFAEIWQ
ncbi:dipeptidase [Paraburkholderia sp. EG285A]|uniref:dipeptidase n=1 Tax=Paraburkholderia sp. EG285A TaxID=3237009 RepID=UPI0034D24888